MDKYSHFRVSDIDKVFDAGVEHNHVEIFSWPGGALLLK